MKGKGDTDRNGIAQASAMPPVFADWRSEEPPIAVPSCARRGPAAAVQDVWNPAAIYLMPLLVLLATTLVSGLVAFIQQSIVLNRDEEEMEAIADKPSKDLKEIPEAEIVATKTKKTAKAKKAKAAKRRKK